MHRLFARLRAHAAYSRPMRGITFCEACRTVCTPACQHDALVDRSHQFVEQIRGRTYGQW